MFDDVDDALFLRQAEATFFGESYEDYWMLTDASDYDETFDEELQ